MTVAAPAHCGATHPVTAGAGAWDVGTCWLPPGHGADCDYQVERPELVVGVLQHYHTRGGRLLKLAYRYCPTCKYANAVHIGGACPTSEAAAVELWGRS